MAMNRSKNDDVKRDAALLREERERLDREGVPLGQALIYLDKLLDHLARYGTVNAMQFPPQYCTLRTHAAAWMGG